MGERTTATDANRTTRRRFLVSVGVSIPGVGAVAPTARAGDRTTGSEGEADRTDPTVRLSGERAFGGRYLPVEEARLPDGGWVAIHEGSVRGPIIGVSPYLAPGRHTSVVTYLDRRIVGEQRVVAMLHRETDDDTDFDFPATGEDGPYRVDDEFVTDSATVTGFLPSVDLDR